MKPTLSPLVAVGRQYILSEASTLCTEQVEQAVGILSRFIDGSYSKVDSIQKLDEIIGSHNSLDKISRILETPTKPIQKSRSKSYNSMHRMQARSWKAYEDQRLLAGVHKFGLENWSRVATFIGNGRTAAQTAQRWFRGLDPSISRDQWSKEEDRELIKLVKKYGDKSWKTVAENLKNRSDVQCRYRYLHMPNKNQKIEEIIQNENKETSQAENQKVLTNNEVVQEKVQNRNRVVLDSIDNILSRVDNEHNLKILNNEIFYFIGQKVPGLPNQPLNLP